MLSWIVPAVISFFITLIFMPNLIHYFRARKEGQMIREEGPSWHEKNQELLRWEDCSLLLQF